ncbi:N-acetylmuramoyl-L-alanine amidase [Dyadobacter aurulentus]|uniref:N-acetylmuramoyl-L-alanine amidase n=1 Tax=Dyadobacter sp. UC 10 TaxID=2605428 RepID=UPI0011F36376|nr:N-acetylmuramoyl-L-alanine amidase [Dyadobacter sp. UC 10]KAA0992777.1 N-acetylmuramoyl-L-alanine amidase [Dyadobacter sp. UC 10]
MAAKKEKRNIILTAGHYGFKSGAWRSWFDEGTETIILRDLLTKALRKRNIKVTNDSNHERTGNVIRWVNQDAAETDLLIEIHFNAVDNPNPSGVECFVQLYEPSDFEKKVATELCEAIETTLNIPNRGVKTPPYSQHRTIGIIDRTKVQAVLLEVCFMSNPSDVNKYRDNLGELVTGISNVIFNNAPL